METIRPKLQATRLLPETLGPSLRGRPERIIVHQGGTRSSKTYSLAQAAMIVMCDPACRGQTLSIVRKTMPALKASAMRDFFEVLTRADLYRPEWHRKDPADLHYHHAPNDFRVEFFSADNAQKVRGRRRERLWVNEGNELLFEDWYQLTIRTTGQIWLDYNPSMLRHWIYDEVLTRPDIHYVESTYLDNPFLPDEQVREIERYRLTDPFRWQVYGLGKRGASPAAVYPETHPSPGLDGGRESVLGLDFGYNDPMVLVRVQRVDREPLPELHIDQLVHESYLTTDDLIQMLPGLGVTKRDVIYCDHDPDRIKMLVRAGYNARAADKSRGSIVAGIDFLKQHRLCFTSRSVRSREEFQDYRWKTLPDETVTDEPVDLNNHAPDAVRYAAFTHWSRSRRAGGAVHGERRPDGRRGLASFR